MLSAAVSQQRNENRRKKRKSPVVARNAEAEGRKKEGKRRGVGVWIAEIVFLIDIKQRKRFNKNRDQDGTGGLFKRQPPFFLSDLFTA